MRWLLVAVVALAVSGCGGSDRRADTAATTTDSETSPSASAETGPSGDDSVETGPSRDDSETMRAVLRTSAAVGEAAQPLVLCAPEDVRCYQRRGPGLAAAATKALAELEPILERTDHPCLARVASRYPASFAAWVDAGRAASEGNVRAFNAAMARATEIEIATYRATGKCGFLEGRLAQLSAALREANIAITRAANTLAACKDEPCVASGAQSLVEAARDTAALLPEYREEAKGALDALPPCFDRALTQFSRVLRGYERIGVALREGRYEFAEKNAPAVDRAYVDLQQRLSSCFAMSATG